MRISWKRLAQVAVLLLAVGFLAALVRSQWSALSGYPWRVEPGWAVLALLALEITWLFELSTWRVILAGLGGRLNLLRAGQVWFLSNIIRYIPGNVWQFLGMVELAAEDGVPRAATFTSIVLHQAISTACGLVLAAVYFGLAPQSAEVHTTVVLSWFARLRPVLLALPLGLLLLHPAILERVLNRLLALVHRPPLRITLTWAGIGVLLLRYVVVWLGMGLSYALLVRAVAPVDWQVFPYLAAAWVGSYVVGYLSMLTPSGLGVREAAMVLLLAPMLPGSVAAVVAIVARLWMVLAEIIGAGLALLTGRKRRPLPGATAAAHDGAPEAEQEAAL